MRKPHMIARRREAEARARALQKPPQIKIEEPIKATVEEPPEKEEKTEE